MVALASQAPGTVSAEPETDRSLTADKPETKAEAEAAALKASASTLPLAAHPAMAINATGPDGEPAAGKIPDNTDLSTLTREQLEARVKLLTENLVTANAGADYFRKQWQDIRLRDEALGVEALTGDESKMSEKLVFAMSELYQSEMKLREAHALMGKLLSTTGQLIQTAPNFDPQVRADYEVASRAAKDYLAGRSGASIPIGTSLNDGQISDVNAALNSVILNLGKTQGVKEGMSFVILRGNEQIGTVKVVLARDLVSAAYVQNTKPNVTLKVGDKAVVSTL